MRHRKSKKKLNCSSSHRRAMFSNMLVSLLKHGRVKTTDRRARELRRIAERAITRAKRLGEALFKLPSELSLEHRMRLVHAMRLSRREIKDRAALRLLYQEWAPRYIDRPGGYTRMFKLGPRRGDAAPMALVELIGAKSPSSARDSKPRK